MARKLLSTVEAAKILGISREAVFKKVKSGAIPAIRVGKNYAIDEKDLGLKESPLTEKRKKEIEKAVKQAFREYGEAIRKLGSA